MEVATRYMLTKVTLVAIAGMLLSSAAAQQVNGVRVQPVATAIVNMNELSFRETLLARPTGPVFFPPPLLVE